MQCFYPGQPRRRVRPKRGCGVRPLLLHCHGSASELEYHLLLAKDLKLVKPKDHAELSQRATELKRMLTALLQKLTADR